MKKDRYRRGFKRARSEAEKESRKRAILAAARAQLARVGVEAFSMVPLAKEAGVVRGTLYLYFPTREELLLTLYVEEVEAWIAELEPLVPGRMAPRDFLRVVYTSATARPSSSTSPRR
ncbi:MAG: TetR/AcrR family transcriptional regulator [Myxococcaceae bacterium]|nr:TetR/AcrR family transcriptional regulator [Myxococcaceae bacterium]